MRADAVETFRSRRWSAVTINETDRRGLPRHGRIKPRAYSAPSSVSDMMPAVLPSR